MSFVLVLLSSLPAASPDKPNFNRAYSELLALFPEDYAGRGPDRGDPNGMNADQPMTYGLVLSAEAVRHQSRPSAESERRVRKTLRWLVDNPRLSSDGKPGWGLPQAWEHRPKNTSYTITTAIVLEGLLDALALDIWRSEERHETLRLVRDVQVRWCRELWVDGHGGGYFRYSPHDKDWLCLNAPAMFLAPLARTLHDYANALPADERELLDSRMQALVRTSVATVMLRDGAPYWHYIEPPNPFNSKRPNDLIHQAYILWGLEAYRELDGRVKLPWTRAQSVESLDRFWKDGTLRFFAQDEATVKPGNREAPANVWGTGMLLACYARWSTPDATRRCFDAILASYGPFPRVRVLPASVSTDDRFYPRDGAHVLMGLAYAAAAK